MHASDFTFSAAAAAVTQDVSRDAFGPTGYDHDAVAAALSMGSSFHSAAFGSGSDAIDHGMATLAMQAHI